MMSTPTPHQVLRQIITAFPDMHHTIDAELREGELIACVMSVHATHQGSFMGIAPTGQEVRFMLLWIDRIVDGTVIQH
jgi:predicted ester cyclase